ncbi:MAG: hypothetical protein ACI3VZ_00445 [Faecousia sp.]
MDNLHSSDRPSGQLLLPKEEMAQLVKRNIHYDDLSCGIAHGYQKGTIDDLDRIVQIVVETQYVKGMITLGRCTLSAEEVAHRILQANQYDVEYLLDALAKHPNEQPSDEQLLASLYCSVSSWAALHHHSYPKG